MDFIYKGTNVPDGNWFPNTDQSITYNNQANPYVYLLTYVDKYCDNSLKSIYTLGLFSTYDKAEQYEQEFMKNNNGFKENNFIVKPMIVDDS